MERGRHRRRRHLCRREEEVLAKDAAEGQVGDAVVALQSSLLDLPSRPEGLCADEESERIKYQRQGQPAVFRPGGWDGM